MEMVDNGVGYGCHFFNSLSSVNSLSFANPLSFVDSPAYVASCNLGTSVLGYCCRFSC